MRTKKRNASENPELIRFFAPKTKKFSKLCVTFWIELTSDALTMILWYVVRNLIFKSIYKRFCRLYWLNSVNARFNGRCLWLLSLQANSKIANLNTVLKIKAQVNLSTWKSMRRWILLFVLGLCALKSGWCVNFIVIFSFYFACYVCLFVYLLASIYSTLFYVLGHPILRRIRRVIFCLNEIQYVAVELT